MRFSPLLVLLGLLLPAAPARAEAALETIATPAERSVPITSALPMKRDIDYVLSALGSVESLNHPTLSAETAGRITRLHADVGSVVSGGELLADIDNTLHQIQAAEAQAELKRQDVLLENQRREVERLKRLEKSQSVSRNLLEDEEDQLRMLHAQRDVAQKRHEHALHLESRTRVVAPHSGSIAHRYVSLGDYVSPGQPLFDLVSVDRLRARLSFPEQDAASIRIGQEVHLQSPAAPHSLAIGEVTQINPRINPLNRAIEVMVEFDNPGGWYPGSSVDATLVVSQNPGALTVPRLSVVTRNNQAVVFLVQGDRAVARPVTLGWQEPDWVEVTRGLADRDRVVVQGAALLSDGSQVSEAADRR